MNISFQRARTTTTVSIKLIAVLILSVQLKTFVTSVYNDPYIFHKTIYSTNRKHGVHLTWRDCLGKCPFGSLLFKLENKQESDSTQSPMTSPPHPLRKNWERRRRLLFRFLLREGGRLYTGYILRYSVFNRDPVIKANKLRKAMQIVELGEAAYYVMNITEWCPLKSVSFKTACPMTICVLTKNGKENFLEDYCLHLLFLYL